MFQQYKKTLSQGFNKSKSKYFPNRNDCIRIFRGQSSENKSTTILEKLHRTPTLHCSARLTLDENGCHHLQRLSAKKQNDSYGRENMWFNTKGRLRSVLILAVLLKILTSRASPCPHWCEPLDTRPSWITEFLAAARSSSPFSFANFQNCKIENSCFYSFSSFLRYFYFWD